MGETMWEKPRESPNSSIFLAFYRFPVMVLGSPAQIASQISSTDAIHSQFISRPSYGLGVVILDVSEMAQVALKRADSVRSV
jgi:hypothetical protein